MPEWLIALAGWLPALFFPFASGLQLKRVISEDDVSAVNEWTWALFALSNVCVYVYAEKYFEPQSFGWLLTALLQAPIFIVVKVRKRRATTSTS